MLAGRTFQHIFSTNYEIMVGMYYEVFVSSQQYHGTSALTYSSDVSLDEGQVVKVPLQRQTVLGVVVLRVAKPKFNTKPISAILPGIIVPKQLLALRQWLAEYYPAPGGMITQVFLPASLSQKPRNVPLQRSSEKPAAGLPPLTDDQQSAISAILASDRTSFLLHGETGTGKTRVYLELVKRAFAEGKSALVLTPEIGLTPQLAQTLEATFPGKVITIHSELTAAARRDRWLEIITAKEPLVVVGPRSSLFSPIAALGVIILDEAHDTAYKQEQMPYYQASRVAAYLASLHGARLVLGTATPLVSDYYTFSAKNLPIVRMEQAAVQVNTEKSVITTVNLRDKQAFSRSPWISDLLIEKIGVALQQKQQTLLFLNRRGSARLIMCQTCGWQALCSRCDLPLTFHGDDHQLRCHTCGLTREVPTNCETCGSTEILFRSVGTKSIVTELGRLFPRATIRRFDSDNLKDDSLAVNYESVRSGKVDILIGTQMLSKGLDLPKLSVVGVVMADTGLAFPDYTAEERTYQMLRQVMGRVGRGHQAGNVIIQTYQPDSPIIQAAIKKDYALFYATQLKEREAYRFPPYSQLLKLHCSRASVKSARTAAEKLAEALRTAKLHIEVVGPSPAFTEKANNRYYWQIIIKAKQRSQLLEVVKQLPANWSYDIDPSNLL